MDAALPLLPASLPFTAEITLDWRVLAVAAGIGLAVSLAIGLLPSLRTPPEALTGALNAASRGSTRGSERLSRAIVVSEVAVSRADLRGAAAIPESAQPATGRYRCACRSRGHRVHRSADGGIPRCRTGRSLLREPGGTCRCGAWRRAGGPVAGLPLGGAGGENLRVPGREGQILVGFKRVDAGYFETLDIPVLAGRGFRPEDREGAQRVIVVNRELARQLASRYELTNPVGARVTLASPHYDGGTGRVEDIIVGVIQDERSRATSVRAAARAYVALAQIPQRQIKLIVRVADLARVMPGVREAVRQLIRSSRSHASRRWSKSRREVWPVRRSRRGSSALSR